MTGLAVVTPSYNDAAFLPECLTSVQHAARRVRFPVRHVVVDDASTDATPTLWGRFPNVRVTRFPENRGTSAALNAAIRMTTAPWLLILAADDIVMSHACLDFANARHRMPAANVIYADLRYFGARHGCYQPPAYESARMRDRNLLTGAAFIRRDLWDAVGGFDESMRTAQDWDFWVRADLVVGLQPVRLPRPLIGYRIHPTPRLHDESARNIVAIRAHIRSLTPETAVLTPLAAVA